MATRYDEKARRQRREAKKRWEAANPEAARLSARKTQLKIKYGITMEEYEAFVVRQGGRCGICATTNPGANRHGQHRYWSVDHDHRSGAVRGLLCSSCNLGLGKLGDTVAGLERALAYLKGE